MTPEEFFDMADKTRAQLAQENEELRARVAELEADPAAVTRPAPTLPSYGLSEGTRLDILEAQQKIQQNARIRSMELVEPFTGRRILVTADDYSMPEEDEVDPETVTTGFDVQPTPVTPEA